MPFTDQTLAAEMAQQIVATGVLSAQELGVLVPNQTTEALVGLHAPGIAGRAPQFNAYWAAIGAWINANGGNFATISAHNTQGRVGGALGIPGKSLYTDAFHDVRQYIGTPGFSVTKAVANTLRFIVHIA